MAAPTAPDVSELSRFAAAPIGFEEINDGIWNVFCGPILVARFDEVSEGVS